MKILIIGGTGHVGTYLVPRLVHLGNTVVCVSRRQREPYTPHAAWRWVERITLDREAEALILRDKPLDLQLDDCRRKADFFISPLAQNRLNDEPSQGQKPADGDAVESQLQKALSDRCRRSA
jgi:nucleoside-diphosphate-sugar epimerase